MGDAFLMDGFAPGPLPMGEDAVEVSLLDLGELGDPDFLAARFLTVEEHAEYGRLQLPRRRREWLGARVCLKAMLVRRGTVAGPLHCAVTKDSAGRPRLSLGPSATAESVYDCSLSHSRRFACAGLSTAADVRIGVDVEEVSPRVERLASVFARDRDVLLRPLPNDERLTILWALKEACSKAIGRGLDPGFPDITCEETSEGRHRLTTAAGLELRARHVVREGSVVALCVLSLTRAGRPPSCAGTPATAAGPGCRECRRRAG